MQQSDQKALIQIVKGSAAGLLCLIFLIITSAVVLYKTMVTEKAYIPLMLVCAMITGIVSGYLAVRKLRKNGLVNGIASTVLPMLMLMISMCIANGQFAVNMLIPSVLLVASGAAGGVAAVNIKRKNKRK